MKIIPVAFAVLLLASCGSSKKATTSSSMNSMTSHLPSGGGNTRTITVEYIDNQTYRLTETTDDKTYGYAQTNPVKVGGAKEMVGPANERRYLNGLAGPNGEEISYHRRGSCCGFQTPSSSFGGMLDIYKVYWKGGTDTLTIYINMYDEGDLKIPVGLTAKKG